MKSIYKIGIVEDSPSDLAVIKSALCRYGDTRDVEFKLAEFETVELLLARYASDFDLIFLDIELPGANGMEGAKRIRQMDQSVGIIFVTNLASFAIDGYQVDALDYVLKPVVYERFAIKLDRALQKLNREQDRFIMAKNLESARKINIRDIIYVEVMSHTLCYHLAGGEDVVVSGKLASLEGDLNGDGFVRCKNCYLVNLRHIDQIRGDEAVMSNGAALKISRGKAERFRETFMRYIAEGGGGR